MELYECVGVLAYLAVVPVLGLLAADAALTGLVHPRVAVEVLGRDVALLNGITDLLLQVRVLAGGPVSRMFIIGCHLMKRVMKGRMNLPHLVVSVNCVKVVSATPLDNIAKVRDLLAGHAAPVR